MQLLASGITVEENRNIARAQGYTGSFGSGGHIAFLEQQGLRKDYTRRVSATLESRNRSMNIQQDIAQTTDTIGAIETLNTGGSLLRSNTGSMIARGIDGAASRIAPGVFSPGKSGVLTNSGTLSMSGALTGAGVGYTTGQLLASFTGLNSTGASIGGAIGGAVGGAGLGASIGIAAGPVGILVGSLAGSGLGGFFGSEPPVNASQFVSFFDKQGQMADGRTASKTIDTSIGETLQQGFGEFTGNISSELGLNLKDVQAFGGFNDKYEGGYFLRTDRFSGDARDIRETFDPANQGSVERAFTNTLDRLVRQNNKNTDVVKRLDELKSQGLTSAQAFSQMLYDSKVSKAVNPEDTRATTPMERVEKRVVQAQQDFTEFVQRTKRGDAGIPSTIMTSNRGILEEPETRKKVAVSLLS